MEGIGFYLGWRASKKQEGGLLYSRRPGMKRRPTRISEETVDITNKLVVMALLIISSHLELVQVVTIFQTSAVVCAYVVIGCVINALIKVIPAEELQNVCRAKRMNLRIFHAWQWPRHLVIAIVLARARDS
jgi:hypothetical protein